ncbi:error-prone DNA polymerase [Ramlibacter rhizophilus]|uniref:Error-prone DNA polymerase n=1 Tax=Ramlibacter rhizophilus TaxID=1781167 RepID=A0A4Z0BVI2_9BURK|nr:error-prone DNA polymerase [Ramlibacter rhizophilus]TFZ03316.1 DNA polymerase III subunit alpha [Ramlibacter rhizophilus]
MPDKQRKDLLRGPFDRPQGHAPKEPAGPFDGDDEAPPPWAGSDELPGYAELHALSNFSFQRGASHPHELVQRAYNLGYEALALTDECSVAGVVQAHVALKEHLKEARRLQEADGQPRLRPFRLIFGSEFRLPEGTVVALARNTFAWGDLCEFISAARRQADKGEYLVGWDRSDWTLLAGCEMLWVPDRDAPGAFDADTLTENLRRARAHLGERLWLGVRLSGELADELWLARLRQAGADCAVPLVAAGGVVMHRRSRKNLHDVITAVREGRPVADCGFALQSNAQRYLRYRTRLAQLYPPELLSATRAVAARCRFTLESIQYNYPLETVRAGCTPIGMLARLTLRGARRRYPQGVSAEHRAQLSKELRLIAAKRYEMFFLTVEDIVRYARSQGILCQGRGSSANSLVCYCLHITEVSPERTRMLFERFISMERHEAPDIDVDFEHQRREEVIQYIYRKYGRERAAIAAVVVRYRSRMAIRDVGKALDIDERLVDAFAKDHHWFEVDIQSDRLVELARGMGVQESAHRIGLWMSLAQQLRGFPRHLSQHVGGFVLTQDRLTRLVPVENAAMPDRSIIQWEKDDLEAMGLLKVDVLALGMLSALRRCLALSNRWRAKDWQLQDIPEEDPQVYDMLCRAESVGVFQVESRAQMAMLPRLRPRRYYDLVVQVAIVRPGPIQGGMVHPYLRARQAQREGKPVRYVKDELALPLGRTLGVPIFQEQVMQLAMVAAGFSADQADALRRSMAAWSRKGGVHRFREPLVEGMVARGYPVEFAEGIFKQIEGFGEYGFPESHAASFALLVYFSSWFKCHEPACFLAGMLNAQPMGFYTPFQLIQDAQRHGVEVRPLDVTASDWDCTLEAPGGSREAHEPIDGRGNALQPAVRLGLRLVAGLSAKGAERIEAARSERPFADVEDLALRAALDRKDMGLLAAADALSTLARHRRQQVWTATAARRAPGLLRDAPIQEDLLHLPQAGEGEDIVFDYAATGLTLRRHPLALLRPRLDEAGWRSAAALGRLPHEARARACGIVNMRQRPPTAKGVMFVTLEDETGTINVIVWNDLVERQRNELLRARLLAVEGTWQRDPQSGGRVRHLVAHRVEDLTPWLGRLAQQGRSRDFH